MGRFTYVNGRLALRHGRISLGRASALVSAICIAWAITGVMVWLAALVVGLLTGRGLT